MRTCVSARACVRVCVCVRARVFVCEGEREREMRNKYANYLLRFLIYCVKFHLHLDLCLPCINHVVSRVFFCLISVGFFLF